MVEHLARAAGADQIAYWNGAGARRWLELAEKQDLVFAPISELLFAHARIAPGERTLDVGCGCGGTTIEAARRVGAAGKAVGVDIAGLLLERARERSPSEARVEFVLADAATQVFPPESFDALISRFGVMFFTEPIAAFEPAPDAGARRARGLRLLARGEAQPLADGPAAGGAALRAAPARARPRRPRPVLLRR